jgi:hypothetical protein
VTPATNTPESGGEHVYWADSPAEELVGHLDKVKSAYCTALDRIGMRVVWRIAFAQNYGMDPRRPGHMDAHEIGFSGDQGENIVFRINDFRSFTKQSITLALGQRPSYRCLATNDDYESLAQIESCDAALSYIANRAYSEDLERSKVEMQKLYGWSWDWHRWDDTAGGDVEVFEDDEQPLATSVKSGAPSVTPKSPMEVVHDVACKDGRHRWVIVADPVSKWELAAEYPIGLDGQDQVEAIIGLSNDENGFPSLNGAKDDFMSMVGSDAVIVEHFYHARTKALPDGRYVGRVGQLVLWDLPLPGEEIPVVCFMPTRIDRTSFGYSDAWDWLPIQQMLDQIISDRATNVAVFGRPNIYMDKGTTMTVDLLAKGGQLFTKEPGTEAPGVVEYPAHGADADQLTSHLLSRLRDISGQNAASRGDPQANVKSGTMAALLHAQASEYASADQQAVDASREKNGNLMLASIKANAQYPFVVEVSGESEMPYADTFDSDRFRAVKRVQVVTANPMQRTVAGRMELLNTMMKVPGAISDPSQITELIVSGQYKPMYRAGRNIKLGIKWENEQLARGIPVPPAMAGENPDEMLEHAALARIPSVRNNPKAMQVLQEHLLSHQQAALMTNPMLAQAMGWQVPTLAPPPMPDDGGGPPGKSGKSPDIAPPKGLAAREESVERGGMGVPLPKPAQSPMQPAAA